MQRKSLRPFFAGLLLAALLLAAAGCSRPPSDADKRLSVLEAEVRSLREEAATREKDMRKQMSMIRANLDSIRELLEVGKGRVAKPGGEADTEDSAGSDDLDRELDVKAKSFVKESLDRLLVITRKLLEKMERELDKQEKPAPSKPEGDEI